MQSKLPQKKTDLLPALIALLLAAVRTFLGKYSFEGTGSAIQLAFTNTALNPSLYSADPMLATRAGYASYYPDVMAQLISWTGNAEMLYFSLFVAGYTLFYFALYHFGRALFDHSTALLFMVLMVFSTPTLGGSTLHPTGLIPLLLATPIGLFALVLLIRKHVLIAFALLGLVMNFHGLTSAYLLCVLSSYCAWLIWKRELPWWKLILGGCSFALLAMPALLWIYDVRGAMTEEWLMLLRERSSHHSFPLSWSGWGYLRYFVFLLLGVIGWHVAAKGSARQFLALLLLTIAGLCVLGLVFSEFIPVQIVLKAQLFRSTGYLSMAVVLCVAAICRQFWKTSTTHSLAALLALLAIATTPRMLTGSIAITALLLAHTRPAFILKLEALTMGFADRIKVWSQHRFVSIAIGVVLLVAVSLAFKSAAWYLARWPLCAVTLLLVALLFYSRNGHWLGSWHRLFGLSTLFIVSILLVHSYQHYHPANRNETGWRGVQHWARVNTDEATIFLTPPTSLGFRIFSERSIVGEWKDGTQQYFSDGYASEWWKRMNDMKCTTSRDQRFLMLETDEYLNLGRTYGADFLVLPSERELSLASVFQNDEYTVYRLTGKN